MQLKHMATFRITLCRTCSFSLNSTVTTGESSNSDSSITVETMEDNPDGGCHIYRNGYDITGISVVGKDVGQHPNRGMGLIMYINVW